MARLMDEEFDLTKTRYGNKKTARKGGEYSLHS